MSRGGTTGGEGARAPAPPAATRERCYCDVRSLPTGRALARTVVAPPTLRRALLRALLPRRDVGVELLLLIGVQDGAQRGDLVFALHVHLLADFLHLRARGHRVTTLPGLTRFLHDGAELLARLLHLRLLLLAKRLEPGLLGVRQGDTLEQRTLRSASATHAAFAPLTVPSATTGLGRIRTGVRLRRLCGGRAGGTNDH